MPLDFEKDIFGNDKQKRHHALLHTVSTKEQIAALFEAIIDRIRAEEAKKKLEALRKRVGKLEKMM